MASKTTSKIVSMGGAGSGSGGTTSGGSLFGAASGVAPAARDAVVAARHQPSPPAHSPSPPPPLVDKLRQRSDESQNTSSRTSDAIVDAKQQVDARPRRSSMSSTPVNNNVAHRSRQEAIKVVCFSFNFDFFPLCCSAAGGFTFYADTARQCSR